MPIHVKSEIAPLLRVLLHRPGRELEHIVPNAMERLLFDDIPYLQGAQREHDAFAATLRAQGAEPVYLEDLVAQVLRSDQGLKLLNHGLSLDGEPLLPARVRWANGEQLQFILHQGKKRQIRRMCELVGLRVLALKRVRVGGVRLGALPVGQWRYLGEDEYF